MIKWVYTEENVLSGLVLEVELESGPGEDVLEVEVLHGVRLTGHVHGRAVVEVLGELLRVQRR